MSPLQAGINDFWSKFSTKKPSKVTSIFPRLLYASILPEHPDPRGIASAVNAAASYEAAAKECRDKVAKIVRECHRTNEKFTDGDFDIEQDLDWARNCLDGLEYVADEVVTPPVVRSRSPSPVRGAKPLPYEHGAKRDGTGRRDQSSYTPGSVHRLDWVFKDPKFTIDGFSSSDIHQGSNGDCWWLAAVATIAHRKDLMNKACVIQNEECGVYGFVFHRDGEWVSTVVDDNVYLRHMDFREAIQFAPDLTDGLYDPTGEKGRKYRAQKQTGSEALYFAHCEDPNETWLPLLEKAFAKVHGEYDAIAAGWSGEAVEDMTGGVTSTISTRRVLSKDKLWKELASKDRDFVFGLSAMPRFQGTAQASGVALGHAYSILDSTEEVDEDGNKFRLVKIRNPWGGRTYEGIGEWNGRWSDGSKEWTAYWMHKLNHTFADDGIFWMLYEDVLETFKFLHRTRLFDEKWTVIQQWTSCEVAWLTGYSRTKFVLDVKKAGTVVIVLAQLDDRYYNGLEGQYRYDLHFLLKPEHAPASDYICRVRPAHPGERRSVNCEVYLEPGRYEVLPKITATRDTKKPLFKKLIEQFAEKKPQKLRQVGMQYDLAHAKGGIPDEDKKILEKKEKAKAKTKGKKTTVTVKVEVDMPSSPTVDKAKDAEETKPHDGEAEKFEDAAENLDSGGAQKPEDQPAGDTRRTLEIRPKGQPSPTGIARGIGNEAAGEVGPDDSKTKHDKVIDEVAKHKSSQEKEHSHGEKKEGVEQEKKEKASETEEEKEESDPEESSDSEEDEDDSRWNAICVTCLRVYSQDPDLTISLVQPQTSEDSEASSSLVQGQDSAGATQ